MIILTYCSVPEKKVVTMKKGISDLKIQETVDSLVKKYGDQSKPLALKGVKHAGSLWRDSDGSEDYFYSFCINYFVGDSAEKTIVFKKSNKYLESLFGHFNKLSLDLRENLDLDNGPINEIDKMFGAYSPGAHFSDDFFANKIAFVIALNFPYYPLEEKNELGVNWNEKEWAYARLGDIFINRIPAELQQKAAEVSTNSDIYISEYNIYMGKLLSEKGKSLFPEDMVLLSHWNLRDELKSDYSNKENSTEKQKIIYEVMKRIIFQEIPEKVINSKEYTWNPFTNKAGREAFGENGGRIG